MVNPRRSKQAGLKDQKVKTKILHLSRNSTKGTEVLYLWKEQPRAKCRRSWASPCQQVVQSQSCYEDSSPLFPVLFPLLAPQCGNAGALGPGGLAQHRLIPWIQGVTWGRNDSARGSSLRPSGCLSMDQWPLARRRLGLSSSGICGDKSLSQSDLGPFPAAPEPLHLYLLKPLIIPGWKNIPKCVFFILTVSCNLPFSTWQFPSR